MALPTSGTVDAADWDSEFNAIVTDLGDATLDVNDSYGSTYNYWNYWYISHHTRDTGADSFLVFTAPDNAIVRSLCVYADDDDGTAISVTLSGEDVTDAIRQGDNVTISGVSGNATSPTSGSGAPGSEALWVGNGGLTRLEFPVALRKGLRYRIAISTQTGGTHESFGATLCLEIQPRTK